MPSNLKRESDVSAERWLAGFRKLEANPPFSDDALQKMATAAGLLRTSEFDRIVRVAANYYLAYRNAAAERATPYDEKRQIRAISAAANRLEMLLKDASPVIELAIGYGAERVRHDDVETGRLLLVGDSGRVSVLAPASNVGGRFDASICFALPTFSYPIEVLRRAAAKAAKPERVGLKVSNLSSLAGFLAEGLKLPLAASVTSESGKRLGGKATGRLVELIVVFTRELSRHTLPELGLPASDIAVTPEGARKAIKRAASTGIWCVASMKSSTN